MIKVFLVDDEYLTIEGLRRLVCWQDYGMEVCGAAYNGADAYARIEELRPEVVFADIRMPGMNGLELIAKVKDRFPHVLFVIISGYNDFEYIRAALKLRVTDYLEKPATVEKIGEALRHIRMILDSRHEMNAILRGNSPQALSAQQTAIARLLRMPDVTEEALLSMQEKLGVNLIGMRNIMVCAMDPAAVEIAEPFERIVDQSLSPLEILFVANRLDGAVYLTLYASEPFAGEEAFRESFRSLCRTLIAEGLVERVGMSAAHSTLCDLPQAVNEAKNAREYAVFFEEELVGVSDVEYRISTPVQLFQEADGITFHLRTGQWNDVRRQVKACVELMKVSKLSPELFCHECLELIYLGMGVCRETGAEFSRDGMFYPHKEIKRYDNCEAIGDWVVGVFGEMVRWMQERRSVKEGKNVLPAKEYIDEHCSEPITLSMLAELCDMHPTYFSVIFKEQVGITYVKYLNEIRMERAKALLKQGMKVKDVYERVGFTSNRYFCDKFKKFTGFTPDQYKRQTL